MNWEGLVRYEMFGGFTFPIQGCFMPAQNCNYFVWTQMYLGTVDSKDNQCNTENWSTYWLEFQWTDQLNRTAAKMPL